MLKKSLIQRHLSFQTKQSQLLLNNNTGKLSQESSITVISGKIPTRPG